MQLHRTDMSIQFIMINLVELTQLIYSDIPLIWIQINWKS